MTAEAIQRPDTAGHGGRQSARTELLESRPVNLDGFVEEWPEVGMVAMDSAFDPEPSVRVENGVIVEMDGVQRADAVVEPRAGREQLAVDRLVADRVHAVEPQPERQQQRRPHQRPHQPALGHDRHRGRREQQVHRHGLEDQPGGHDIVRW